MNTAGSREPGCYFTQEIGMKYKEDDARALSGRKKQVRQTSDRFMTNQMDYKKKKSHLCNSVLCNQNQPLPSGWGCDLKPNSKEKSGLSQSL